MSTALVSIEDQVEIPLDLRTLDDFRRWMLSDEFPERGRIDYIDGRIEVDMSPESAFTHSTPKVALAHALFPFAEENDFGWLFCDRMRIANVAANLSAEPDLMIITEESFTKGRVVAVEGAADTPDEIMEFEGSPDLVVEIVSKSSVRKDTVRLPKAYFAAGVREFWLVDVRRDQLTFVIHKRAKTKFTPQTVDADGFQFSSVLNAGFLLTRRKSPSGRWRYRLALQ